MVHDLGSERSDSFFDAGLITKVDPMHFRRRVDIGFVAGAEVVEDAHLMARRDVCVDDVGPDETGTTCDENSHSLSTRLVVQRNAGMVSRHPVGVGQLDVVAHDPIAWFVVHAAGRTLQPVEHDVLVEARGHAVG